MLRTCVVGPSGPRVVANDFLRFLPSSAVKRHTEFGTGGSLRTAPPPPPSGCGPLRAVILLNSPLNGAYELSLYRALRRHDGWRATQGCEPLFVCADGAIEFLRRATDADRDPTAALAALWPDVLCGDMDSSTEASRRVVAAVAFHVSNVAALGRDDEFARLAKGWSALPRGAGDDGGAQRRSCTVHVADQDSTDFDKCVQLLRVLEEHRLLEEPQVPPAVMGGIGGRVLVLGALGGRMDHELAAINCLACNDDVFLVLHNAFNTMFVCAPGTSTRFLPDQYFEGTTCGLIPLGTHLGCCRTEGFKWEIASPTAASLGTRFGFGGMLSTSNEIVDPAVGVLIDLSDSVPGDPDAPPLLFTIATRDAA